MGGKVKRGGSKTTEGGAEATYLLPPPPASTGDVPNRLAVLRDRQGSACSPPADCQATAPHPMDPPPSPAVGSAAHRRGLPVVVVGDCTTPASLRRSGNPSAPPAGSVSVSSCRSPAPMAARQRQKTAWAATFTQGSFTHYNNSSHRSVLYVAVK